MTPQLPARPHLGHLKKQAKALLRRHRAADPIAVERVDAAYSRLERFGPPEHLSHADALRVIAHEYGFSSWAALSAHIGASKGDKTVRDTLLQEADEILEAHRRGDGVPALQIRDWVPELIGKSAAQLADTPLSLDQVLAGAAREHGFSGWDAIDESAAATDPAFETAVEAVVNGDIDALGALLDERPELVEMRSAFGHRATLLHYVAANGVETRRQKSPANAAQIAHRLIAAGSDPDALCETYGGGSSQTPLCLTVTSGHPAEAGVQAAIVAELLDGGARVDGLEDDGAPLRLAFDFGYMETARLLARRAARVEDITIAATLGLIERVAELQDAAPESERDAAFVAACGAGQMAVARRLFEAGAPIGARSSSGETGLHLAAFQGHAAVVEWLLTEGADPAALDEQWQRTPSEWATHGGHAALGSRIARHRDALRA